MTRIDPEWIQKYITRDETWEYQYDLETKPQKGRIAKYKVKTLLVKFFDINCLVHHEFIPFGRTIVRVSGECTYWQCQVEMLKANPTYKPPATGSQYAYSLNTHVMSHSLAMPTFVSCPPPMTGWEFIGGWPLRIYGIGKLKRRLSIVFILTANSGKLGDVHTKTKRQVVLGKFREQIGVELSSERWSDEKFSY
ncbi:hypothetical protein LAZ67_11003308 [Cordylochernes scorpioides]|uniref:Uncharacterized protein n=1 Tax=Cordylochernes scorpioides TaxID=51811 RepID=A0ABY6KZR5_9ARAC|nr:hypothetical protein LAZ67_11003308 [Cordylochernes scorpioides]